MSEHRAQLSAELERGAIRELVKGYQIVNHTYFRGGLRLPVLGLEDTDRLGVWKAESRTLALSRTLVFTQSWGAVLEVLKHEMAHQYVSEVLRVNDETAHGPAFQGVCARLGIDPRASGLPAEVRSAEEERVLERISKLLALAQSDNQHEAESAMKAAQALMLKHNLADAPQTARVYGFRHLGRPTGRVQEHERGLAALLTTHFFVDAIWVPSYRADVGKTGTVLEVIGTDANLALSEYVYSFMMGTAERLWKAHQQRHRIRSNRDRRPFLAGVMAGFREKLDEGAREQKSAGLVWVKDGQLDTYFRKRHPRIRNVRYGTSSREAAHGSGREAGRHIVLHKPVAEGPSGGVRLLGRAGASGK